MAGVGRWRLTLLIEVIKGLIEPQLLHVFLILDLHVFGDVRRLRLKVGFRAVLRLGLVVFVNHVLDVHHRLALVGVVLDFNELFVFFASHPRRRPRGMGRAVRLPFIVDRKRDHFALGRFRSFVLLFDCV